MILNKKLLSKLEKLHKIKDLKYLFTARGKIRAKHSYGNDPYPLKGLIFNFKSFSMKYYVNKNAQSTGEHEVHTESCSHQPYPYNREYLGEFSSCHSAIQKARQFYSNVDGCKHCSEPCHKR